jgi:uncharacterized protein
MVIREASPPGRHAIERYGPGGFRIAGVIFTGPVLVRPEASFAWPVESFAQIDAASLRPLVEPGGVELLLIGTGRSMQPLPRPLRAALAEAGLRVDAMDSAAACRTYNVLLAEDRRIAAALLPLRF